MDAAAFHGRELLNVTRVVYSSKVLLFVYFLLELIQKDWELC